VPVNPAAVDMLKPKRFNDVTEPVGIASVSVFQAARHGRNTEFCILAPKFTANV